jgi:hypothetical protein
MPVFETILVGESAVQQGTFVSQSNRSNVTIQAMSGSASFNRV